MENEMKIAEKSIKNRSKTAQKSMKNQSKIEWKFVCKIDPTSNVKFN